jgi:pyrroline-5-carboxylate reductase
MRIKKPKLFSITSKVMVDMIIVADSKEEALAWSQQELPYFIVVNPNNNEAIIQNNIVILSTKKPKKHSKSFDEYMNGNL